MKERGIEVVPLSEVMEEPTDKLQRPSTRSSLNPVE